MTHACRNLALGAILTQHDRHATTRKYEMASQQIKAMAAAPKRQRPHMRGLLRCRICQKRQASTNSLPQSYFAVENLRGIDKSFSLFQRAGNLLGRLLNLFPNRHLAHHHSCFHLPSLRQAVETPPNATVLPKKTKHRPTWQLAASFLAWP